MQQPPPRPGVRHRVPVGRRIAEGIPDWFVVLMCCWTLAFWAGLALGWDVEVIGIVTVAELLAVLVFTSRAGSTWSRPRDVEVDATRSAIPLRSRALVLVCYVLAVVLAVSVSRALALLVLLLAAVAVLVRQWWLAGRAQAAPLGVGAQPRAGQWQGRRMPAQQALGDDDEPATSRWWLPGLGLAALAMAVVSTQFSRPDGDDVYFVGFSTYVAEHGLIPLRDTLMSPQVFPAPQTYDPPLHSWEALIGLGARLAGVSAPLMTYSVVLPVMVVVSVLTLGRLIRVSRVPWPLLGLWTAIALLLLDGADQATFGLLWITRLWVGKTVLVSVLVPLLVVYGQRWVRQRRPQDLAMLVATAIAALGVSSSAVFVVPLALAALAVAALALRRVWAAVPLLAPMVPPLVVGGLTLLLAPPPPAGPTQPLPVWLDGPDPNLGSATSDLLHLFVLSGWHLVVVVAAATVGVLGLRSRCARTVVVALLAVFAVMVSPPGNALVRTVLPELDSVMWRMWFLVPLPLLFAALPAGVVLLVSGSVERLRLARGSTWLWLARPVLAVLVAVSAAGGFVQFGPSILAEPGAHRSSWLDLKAEDGAEEAFDIVARQARDGDVVLSPSASARLIPIVTSRWFAVAPRLDYLRSGFYRSLPRVHAVDRLRMQSWVRGQSTEPTDELRHELDLLGVDLVCTNGEATGRVRQMLDLGWKQTAQGLYACFRRPG